MTADFGTTRYCRKCGLEIVREGDLITISEGDKFCECEEEKMGEDGK
jgi:hypothetical protein